MARQIPIHNKDGIIDGMSVTVDDEDCERLMQYKWLVQAVKRKAGYSLVIFRNVYRGNGKTVRITHEILELPVYGGCWVKYRDGNVLNNMKENFEIIPVRMKKTERRKRIINPGRQSQYIGVKWNTSAGYWDVLVQDENGQEFRLTGRKNEEEAGHEYDRYLIIKFINNGFDPPTKTNFPIDDYPEYTDGRTTLLCARCKQRKPIYLFSLGPTPTNPNRRGGVCHDCKRIYQRGRIRIRKDRVREKINELKNVPCADCGVKYAPHIMQFHHIDPTTKEHLISQCSSVRELIRETEKCVVLCANCHLEREWGENGLSTLRITGGTKPIDGKILNVIAREA